MVVQQPVGQVVLKGGKSASALLYEVLVDTLAVFPTSFAKLELPLDTDSFRKKYAEILPQFEAARIAGVERTTIARHMAQALLQSVEWQTGAGAEPLHESLRQPAEPATLSQHSFSKKGDLGWCPRLDYHGQRWQGDQTLDFSFEQLGDRLVTTGMATQHAGDALSWIANEVLDAGNLRLAGRKIAVIGAGAEMAPTRMWLEAGADIMWLDTQPPPRSWWDMPGIAGRLFWPQQNVDLLANPHTVLATLIAFADGEPMDIGLYAYAPGQAREIRLTAAMNAIVNAIPTSLISSVTMLVSPTTPVELSTHDLAMRGTRILARPLWERGFDSLGLLGGGGSVVNGRTSVVRSVVPIQGASYQAAQYLGKIMMAECWSQHGQLEMGSPQALRVSANTAAITRTRSLSHPVFNAAFGGAAALGVETMTPEQSRQLNGLLAVRDWLHPDLPLPGRIRVHGGIHTLPYPLHSALRVAAMIGFVRSPRLLLGSMR